MRKKKKMQAMSPEEAMEYINSIIDGETEMSDGKYILRKEQTTLEDIKASIVRLYTEKVNNPDKYKTGKLNEFNEEIELFGPSVVIIDSITL